MEKKRGPFTEPRPDFNDYPGNLPAWAAADNAWEARKRAHETGQAPPRVPEARNIGRLDDELEELPADLNPTIKKILIEGRPKQNKGEDPSTYEHRKTMYKNARDYLDRYYEAALDRRRQKEVREDVKAAHAAIANEVAQGRTPRRGPYVEPEPTLDDIALGQPLATRSDQLAAARQAWAKRILAHRDATAGEHDLSDDEFRLVPSDGEEEEGEGEEEEEEVASGADGESMDGEDEQRLMDERRRKPFQPARADIIELSSDEPDEATHALMNKRRRIRMPQEKRFGETGFYKRDKNGLLIKDRSTAKWNAIAKGKATKERNRQAKLAPDQREKPAPVIRPRPVDGHKGNPIDLVNDVNEAMYLDEVLSEQEEEAEVVLKVAEKHLDEMEDLERERGEGREEAGELAEGYDMEMDDEIERIREREVEAAVRAIRATQDELIGLQALRRNTQANIAAGNAKLEELGEEPVPQRKKKLNKAQRIAQAKKASDARQANRNKRPPSSDEEEEKEKEVQGRKSARFERKA